MTTTQVLLDDDEQVLRSTCAVGTARRATVPATGVVIAASIFIASIVATCRPAATVVALRRP